jgi:hypothetical protein
MKEMACPHCGALVSIDRPVEAAIPPTTPPEAAYTIETIVPATYDDDARLPLMRVEIAPPANGGDPQLLAVADTSIPRSDGEFAIAAQPVPSEIDSREVEPGSGDEFRGSDPDPILGLLRRTPSPDGTNDSHDATLIAHGAMSSRNLAPAVAAPAPAPAAAQDSPDQREVDGDEPRAIGIGVVLLASYASAVTLALIWLLATGRASLSAAPPPTIATDSRPDLGADGKRALPPPEQIADDLLAALGQTIRVGSLEVTPKEIRTGTVFLERVGADGAREQRNGGHEALLLKVLVTNVSKADVLTPLERAFVRKPDRGIPECFIETGRGERIDHYPLALESEWSIAGQKFVALKPGESVDAVVVSEKDAKRRLADPMTWRFRIRGDSDKTHLIGVRFAADDIR